MSISTTTSTPPGRDDRQSSPLLRQVLPGRREVARARRLLHLKAVLISAVFLAGYAGLVFMPGGWVWKALSAVVLIHGSVAIATGIMHDANHSAFSRSKRVNRALSYSADLLGASSMLWRRQHNVLHHHHTNVMGVDSDIEQAPFARLSPHQEHRPWHRFQHLYMWPLYGFLIIKWFLYGDLRTLRAAYHGPAAQRPTRGELLFLIGGKAVHVGWAVIIPSMLHPWTTVILVYLGCSWVVGFLLAVTFQVAHAVDRAEFIAQGAELTGDAMLAHQLSTTVDVAARNQVVKAYLWFLVGGLDHQVEHHLAPRLPHTVYPAMTRTVDAVCAANFLERRTHGGVRSAIASHQRWLRAMGAVPTA